VWPCGISGAPWIHCLWPIDFLSHFDLQRR
jgi:hypothetical protein